MTSPFVSICIPFCTPFASFFFTCNCQLYRDPDFSGYREMIPEAPLFKRRQLLYQAFHKMTLVRP